MGRFRSLGHVQFIEMSSLGGGPLVLGPTAVAGRRGHEPVPAEMPRVADEFHLDGVLDPIQGGWVQLADPDRAPDRRDRHDWTPSREQNAK